jgi:hypothetical protein
MPRDSGRPRSEPPTGSEGVREALRQAESSAELRAALDAAGEYVDTHPDHPDLEGLLASIHVASMELDARAERPPDGEVPAPMCLGCLHLRTRSREGEPARCDAFPGGIPVGIYWRSGDHTRPWPGDGGLRFEQDPARPTVPIEAFR